MNSEHPSALVEIPPREGERETQRQPSAVISLHVMTRGFVTLQEDREVISEAYLDICKIKEKLRLSVMLATWT